MRKLTLQDYVKRRNGVPLGATGSLQNMLIRSFGASSFEKFWWYWNPIWGFYLYKFFQRPASRFVPKSIALIYTFLMSGLIHDVPMLISKGTMIFTPWFGVMSLVILLTRNLELNLNGYHWLVRAFVNILFVLISLVLALWLVGAL